MHKKYQLFIFLFLQSCSSFSILFYFFLIDYYCHNLKFLSFLSYFQDSIDVFSLKYKRNDPLDYNKKSIDRFLSIKYYRIEISILLVRLTPVDPAGPDCYQSGTKPCESTQQYVAYGSVTRSQHAQGTWITSGN